MNFSFDDVLIVPKFSAIHSRKDVNLSQEFCGKEYRLPIISSNMTGVTHSGMAKAMNHFGAVGCLHRFQSIIANLEMFKDSMNIYGNAPWVSVGLGELELERAVALRDLGADIFVLDIAHGAQMSVVDQTKKLRSILGKSAHLIIGNFATGRSIKDFLYHYGASDIGSFKVGIGGGSVCSTRIVTGCGVPTLSSITDCLSAGHPVIADGGMRNSGDIAKALGAGASMVMLGGMLAGCDESPGDVVNGFKKYKGSASNDSYVEQGKTAKWRSPEGESTFIKCSGSLENILQQIEGGLRSALTYVGAKNLTEFKDHVDFISITSNGLRESHPHAKINS